ncbi:hypothetical protein [Agrobacterium sp. fls2-241-TYG-188a]|uniref:hypothetical protein n=1 Tax=Agrobacterium sp. fls2-241-TYG-188a TaxID=3040275 RepID=UPI00254B70F4|nr:hypothetical protein [Agrobacterium sp. fls2-241-TYG-188a]
MTSRSYGFPAAKSREIQSGNGKNSPKHPGGTPILNVYATFDLAGRFSLDVRRFDRFQPLRNFQSIRAD